MKAQFFFLLHCALSLEAAAQVTHSFELGKKQALQLIRKNHSEICAVKNSRYISPMYFQQELFSINKKYTVTWADSIDSKNFKVREQPEFSSSTQNGCKYDLYFANKLLDNFIFCEVIPEGDKTFIVTEVYLFQIKGNRLRFISKKEVSYN